MLSAVDVTVEFDVNGSANEIESKLTLPSLPAKILINNQQVHGHHEGHRLMRSVPRSLWAFGARTNTIEASGEGRFVSPELTYTGHFLGGKAHDNTGAATASIGATQTYTGGFDDGHLSGQGVLMRLIGGTWRKTFEGIWQQGKPWTGTHFDAVGGEMMTTHNGIITAVLGKVSELLSQTNLCDIVGSGDATVLLELQQLDGLGAIKDINQPQTVTLTGWSSPRTWPLLHIACFEGHPTVVEVLLQVPGVDMHWSYDGWTALMRASSRGHTTVVQALLTDNRADVNARDLV